QKWEAEVLFGGFVDLARETQSAAGSEGDDEAVAGLDVVSRSVRVDGLRATRTRVDHDVDHAFGLHFVCGVDHPQLSKLNRSASRCNRVLCSSAVARSRSTISGFARAMKVSSCNRASSFSSSFDVLSISRFVDSQSLVVSTRPAMGRCTSTPSAVAVK